MENYYGLIAAILSPFFSSVATIFKSGATKNLSPLLVIVAGGIIGAVLLFLLAKLFHEKLTFKKIKENKKDLLLVFLFRSLLGELFLTFGLSQTEAVKAIFLTKIEPYFVLILAWIFLKEKVQPKHLILLLIHLIGVIILSTGGKMDIVNRAQIGDLFIVISIAFFAVSYNYGKKLAHNIGPISSNAITMGAASLLLLPFLFISSSMQKLNHPLGYTYLIIYVVLFNVIALTLWYASLKSVKGWIVSALRYIGAILGLPIAYLVLGESLNKNQILGAIIVVTTSFLIVKEHLRQTKNLAKEL